MPVPSKSAAVTSASALIPALLNAPAKVAYPPQDADAAVGDSALIPGGVHRLHGDRRLAEMGVRRHRDVPACRDDLAAAYLAWG